MPISLDGIFKTYVNPKMNTGKDGCTYQITQTSSGLYFKGDNQKKDWHLIGYAHIPDEFEKDTELELHWADTFDSNSPEASKEHIYNIKVLSNNRTEVIRVLKGNALACGNWERKNGRGLRTN